VPGEGGAFEILKGHAPIISTLSAGNIKVISEELLHISISGGFVEVANDEVSICVEI
jgi:F-type H+-transporting ATPase subunit epsilon